MLTLSLPSVDFCRHGEIVSQREVRSELCGVDLSEWGHFEPVCNSEKPGSPCHFSVCLTVWDSLRNYSCGFSGV